MALNVLPGLYNIATIVDHDFSNGELKFQMEWHNVRILLSNFTRIPNFYFFKYPSSENTFEPYSDIKNCILLHRSEE